MSPEKVGKATTKETATTARRRETKRRKVRYDTTGSAAKSSCRPTLNHHVPDSPVASTSIVGSSVTLRQAV